MIQGRVDRKENGVGGIGAGVGGGGGRGVWEGEMGRGQQGGGDCDGVTGR